MTLIPTSSQTIGPFFREALERPAWSDLTRDGVSGPVIRIEGVVRDGDGEPVPDAMLELWQADANGRYAHPEDTGRASSGPAFRGFGRACTDAQGRYWFATIVPGAVAGPDGRAQAPHANLTIFARGLLKRLVTRIYFADRASENASDALLSSIADADARATLIAPRTERADGTAVYRFDIVLQGAGETAFLAI
ncbi:MAG: protocatechuate 3,4-dioxygenase, alpha subunit [Candidatus Eremiobacteraeota bacterium]|jgi:protocatechuate 3,4-dioxygenase alpha subunit|nr:protocatechuate 3,4-dioxygenase, alpha subunit [Candidatus Eremiobacteraeota bacterium]